MSRPGLVVTSAALLLTLASPAASASPQLGNLPVSRLTPSREPRVPLLAAPTAAAPVGPAKAPRPLRGFSVRLRSPRRGELLSGQVEIRADVTADRTDEVLFVEFEVDGKVLFADARPPYELAWRASGAARHRVVARAFGPTGEMVQHVVVTGAPRAIDSAAAFASRVDRVEIYARVEGGPGLEGLRASDFVVLERGLEQPIVNVERTSNLPVAIGLMVDCSGSMVERLNVVLETAGSFIEGLVTSEHDKAFVMSFADLPSVLQEFTNDVDRLSTSLELISAGRYTKLYDAIVTASSEFSGHVGRRALVLLTDGQDADSIVHLDDAIRAAQRADVAVYPVAIDLTSQYFHERWVLEQLARRTGGRVSYMGSFDGPEDTYERIAEDLRAQYRITYEPRRRGGDGEWRAIEVQLANAAMMKKYRVRTRAGYFAE